MGITHGWGSCCDQETWNLLLKSSRHSLGDDLWCASIRDVAAAAVDSSAAPAAGKSPEVLLWARVMGMLQRWFRPATVHPDRPIQT